MQELVLEEQELATVDFVRATRPPDGSWSLPRLWGPVSRSDARAVGALDGTASVLLDIRGWFLSELMGAVRALVPEEVIPRRDDTPESLARRIGETDFFDDAHVLKGGCGPRRVRLNSTTYPQPRRVTWSAIVRTDESSHWLYTYPTLYREPEDWRCRPMPMAVFELAVFLWKAAWPYLSPRSRLSPPVLGVLMGYFAVFSSRAGRHRDSFTTDHLEDFMLGFDPLQPENEENWPYSQALGTWYSPMGQPRCSCGFRFRAMITQRATETSMSSTRCSTCVCQRAPCSFSPRETICSSATRRSSPSLICSSTAAAPIASHTCSAGFRSHGCAPSTGPLPSGTPFGVRQRGSSRARRGSGRSRMREREPRHVRGGTVSYT